jgi:hypothetical protein
MDESLVADYAFEVRLATLDCAASVENIVIRANNNVDAEASRIHAAIRDAVLVELDEIFHAMELPELIVDLRGINDGTWLLPQAVCTTVSTGIRYAKSKFTNVNVEASQFILLGDHFQLITYDMVGRPNRICLPVQL